MPRESPRRTLPRSWIVLPLAFFAVMVLFYSFRFVFEFDRDEGVNAIKALLVLRGFRLYGEIWNDQPPVFTLLLAQWFRIFGLRVAAGRVLVLLFSTGLVGASAYYLRRWWGLAASLAGVAFLALLPLYLELSVSIMIGLPAISLAFLAFVSHAKWHENRRAVWLLLSSGLLALSVLTKAFTVILVPLFAIGIVLAIRERRAEAGDPLRAWAPLIAWILAWVGVCGLVLMLVVRPENLPQLVQVHLAAERAPAFQLSDRLPGINVLLLRSLPVLLLAIAGAVLAYRRRKWTALYLAAWAAAAYLLLYFNRPTWPHQQLLLTVPAAVLAAAALGSAVEDLIERIDLRSIASAFRPLSLAAVGLAAWFLAAQLLVALRQLEPDLPNLWFDPSSNLEERQIVALLWNHAPGTEWLFTDRPMFAFLADLPVPPHLAVFSSKRLRSGELSPEEILDVLEAYEPELILKGGRFDMPYVDEYMQRRDYPRIDDTTSYRLYLRQENP